ncbi:protein RD3-like isoform 1-T1 [Clarias gariepinus]
MESHYHGYHRVNPRNSSRQDGELGPSSVTSMGTAQVLLQELLWQFKQREYPVLEKEHHRCSHGALGYRRALTWDSLLALIPASECKLLERLCARISPSHTAAVLFRFREILAHNYVVPWELVCIFKQVLKDFLRRQEEVGYRRSFPPAPPTLLPVSPPPADIKARDRKTTKSTSSPEGQGNHREEIPTISSYVDRHLHGACSYSVQRDCLPY